VPPSDSLDIVQADTATRLADACALLLEHATSIADTAYLGDFNAELAGLPGAYAPPGGALLLAYRGSQAIGCVCLHDLGSGICEMKRLYVRPAHRSAGAGRALVEAVIERAKSLHYLTLRLDTMPFMESAIGLYRQLGFAPIEAYNEGGGQGAMWFELALRESTATSEK
jgi:GNAT superfamily N-acetyltransferase